MLKDLNSNNTLLERQMKGSHVLDLIDSSYDFSSANSALYSKFMSIQSSYSSLDTIVSDIECNINKYNDLRADVEAALFNQCDIPNFVVPKYHQAVTTYPFDIPQGG